MTPPPENLAPALEFFQRGDLQGALLAVENALAEAPRSPALLAFAGLIAGKLGDHGREITYLGRLLEIAPADHATRFNLAKALLAVGRMDDADAICASGANDPKILRLHAYVHQQRGKLEDAAYAYESVLQYFPADFESWNNLGNVRAAMGDVDAAVKAFEKAITFQPGVAQIYINLADVLAKAGRMDARQNVMHAAARAVPNHPEILVELGLAEAAMQDFEGAERAFREAIRLSKRFTPAYLELGLLLENLNRIVELDALVDEAAASGLDEPEIDFLKAWALRRGGRLAEAMALARGVPHSINPIRRAQLIAELADRLGETDLAFAEFTKMNEAAIAARPGPPNDSYRSEVAGNAALVTPEWIDGWSQIDLDLSPVAPIFIVGFPRSGTTLLDTLLMNLPNLHVLEELPVLHQVGEALGRDERLASLTAEEATELRAKYFGSLEAISPMRRDQIVIDKHPLHMPRMGLIHRIFPDAKVILVERHPCDCVLSCFMANFQLNHAMRSFTTLDEAAKLYDAVFDIWTKTTTLLPINYHPIRYERLVADLEGELRSLLSFLDLPWDPKVMDNQASAAKRDHIRTASYSQVTEGIYTRSVARWERYRSQMADVLPVLAPWAHRMGYGI